MVVNDFKMYMILFVFFEVLWDVGVIYVFVNLGFDYLSIIEVMVKGVCEKKGQFFWIIMCFNEVGLCIVVLGGDV